MEKYDSNFPEITDWELFIIPAIVILQADDFF
jgi:hypothetical protein